jgi:hypothetical protein
MHGNHLKHMLVGGAVVLGALLIVGVPVGTALPYALLLACPLMMLFMMRGHGHGGHQHDAGDQAPEIDRAADSEPSGPTGRRDKG